MRVLKVCLFIFSSFLFSYELAFAIPKEGCGLGGSAIYPNPTGAFDPGPAPDFVPIPRYYDTNSFPIKNQGQAANACGIFRDKTTNGGSCRIYDSSGSIGYGVKYFYDSSDITCDVPFDNYIPVAIFFFGVLGALQITKKSTAISHII